MRGLGGGERPRRCSHKSHLGLPTLFQLMLPTHASRPGVPAIAFTQGDPRAASLVAAVPCGSGNGVQRPTLPPCAGGDSAWVDHMNTGRAAFQKPKSKTDTLVRVPKVGSAAGPPAPPPPPGK